MLARYKADNIISAFILYVIVCFYVHGAPDVVQENLVDGYVWVKGNDLSNDPEYTSMTNAHFNLP